VLAAGSERRSILLCRGRCSNNYSQARRAYADAHPGTPALMQKDWIETEQHERELAAAAEVLSLFLVPKMQRCERM
jgi:hypothetical protein